MHIILFFKPKNTNTLIEYGLLSIQKPIVARAWHRKVKNNYQSERKN